MGKYKKTAQLDNTSPPPPNKGKKKRKKEKIHIQNNKKQNITLSK